MLLQGFAWVMMVATAVVMIGYPALIGKPRKSRTYGDWIGILVQGAIIIPLCLRVLGFI